MSEKPIALLGMPFDEALARFIATDPKEARASMKRWKRERDKAVADAPNVTTIKRLKERRYNGK